MNLPRQPIVQAAVVLVAAYVLFEYVIGYGLPLVGVSSAPVPQTVILQYMAIVIVGVLVYFSADEARWKSFMQPVCDTLTLPDRRVPRGLLMVAIPVMAGWMTYQNVRLSFGAPATLRSIHPAPPGEITFRGEPITLTGLENPLRSSGSMEEHIALGRSIYTVNCVPCHGDRMDGEGHFAPAFNPVPADFTSGGVLPQLTESFVFWRIVKGGPGLPTEGTPWDSAMPAWENILEQHEIWATIIYLYEQTGFSPRTWHEAEGEAH